MKLACALGLFAQAARAEASNTWSFEEKGDWEASGLAAIEPLVEFTSRLHSEFGEHPPTDADDALRTFRIVLESVLKTRSEEALKRAGLGASGLQNGLKLPKSAQNLVSLLGGGRAQGEEEKCTVQYTFSYNGCDAPVRAQTMGIGFDSSETADATAPRSTRSITPQEETKEFKDADLLAADGDTEGTPSGAEDETTILGTPVEEVILSASPLSVSDGPTDGIEVPLLSSVIHSSPTKQHRSPIADEDDELPMWSPLSSTGLILNDWRDRCPELTDAAWLLFEQPRATLTTERIIMTQPEPVVIISIVYPELPRSVVYRRIPGFSDAAKEAELGTVLENVLCTCLMVPRGQTYAIGLPANDADEPLAIQITVSPGQLSVSHVLRLLKAAVSGRD